MNLGVITTSFPVTEKSSSGIFILRLIEHLPKDTKIIVVTPDYTESGNDDHHLPENISIHRVRYAPKSLQLLCHGPGGIPEALRKHKWLYLFLPVMFMMVWLKCLFISRKIDIYYANWSICGVVAAVAGRIMGKKCITTLRGSDVNLAISSALHRQILRLCLMFNHTTVAVSTSIYQEINRMFPSYQSKTTVITNGIEEDLLNINNDRAKNNDTTFSLLAIGNLTKNKGFDQAIKALHLVHDPYITLTIVGGGPEKDYLTNLIEQYNMGSTVKLTDRVAPDEVKHYLSSADALLMTSFNEGRPNVVLEAMASGLIIIGSAIPGVKEIIQDEINGILYQPGNIEELAEKIHLLRKNSSIYVSLGKNARRYIIDNKLTWQHSASQYNDLFHMALMTRQGN